MICSPKQEEIGPLLMESKGIGLASLLRSRGFSTRIEGLDLSNLDLKEVDLSEIDWVRCNFSESDLATHSLSNATFLDSLFFNRLSPM